MAINPESNDYTLQQNLFRVLAAVETLTDRQREMIEGAKERDKRLEMLSNNMRDLAVSFREMTYDAKMRDERHEAAIRDIKHEKRNTDQVVNSRLEMIDNSLKLLDSRYQETRTKVDELIVSTAQIKKDTAALQEPVVQLVSLRNRMMAVATLGVSVLGVFWFIGQPILVWFTTHILNYFFGSREHIP